MSTNEDQPELLDVARGNKARSEFLKAALKKVRDSSEDDEFRREVDAILSGKKGLRQAATNEVFNRGISSMVTRGVQQYNELDEQQREELSDQGERGFASLDEQLRAVGSSGPRRGQRRRPAAEEEDEPGFDEVKTWLV